MFCYRFNGFCASLEMDGKSTGFFARPMRTCRKQKPVSQMRNFSPTNDRNYEGQTLGPKRNRERNQFDFIFTCRLHLPLAFATLRKLLELSPFSTIYLHGGDVAGGAALYGQLGNISTERHFSGDVELKVYQKNVC